MNSAPIKPHIIIPMAGRGSRTQDGWPETPKMLIPVSPGLDILDLALAFLPRRSLAAVTLVFIILREHEARLDLSARLRSRWPAAQIHIVPAVLPGQLATTLEYLTSDQGAPARAAPVLVHNCDTLVRFDLSAALAGLDSAACRVVCAGSHDPALCYAEATAAGRITALLEKTGRITPHASTGTYLFATGQMLIEAGAQAISDQPDAAEHFISSAINGLIARSDPVTLHPAAGFTPLGTTQQIRDYQEHLR
ncbi:hypothetical protein ACG74X_19575 [Marivita sp. S0852]|uniref:hypothetical protein n=1 Tax=Marivita sp. S0852 TaxID=3373893 RepID=UPI003981DB59